nr:class I SAM-dependent methyltransferase [uncultured Mucilaginibacter sp.]
MANNYDNAAWFYDRLSRLVFGNAIIQSQVYLLQYLPPASNILIVGGGTGWILDEIIRLHPAGLKITYVEISAKMMAISTKRNIGANHVTFINSAVEDIVLKPDFNVIVTPFLFDNFNEQTAQKIFNHLHSSLKPEGLWLYTDFEPTGKLWQKILLKTMHTFFKILCGIEATKLPDVKHLFAKQRYKHVNSKAFLGDFVKATVYSRQG